MRFTKILLKISFLLLIVTVSQAYSIDYIFFLLDKSNSMWAQQPETKQPVFELAKEKIYSIVNKLPDLSGRRKVKIILFDSKRRNTFEISVKCVDDAKKWLAPIKPGGKTIIGDRLEEVRKEIIETGSRDVEVHLFSDLIESDVGDLSLDDAIKKLNKSLNQGKLKPIDWTLRAYTWKGAK